MRAARVVGALALALPFAVAGEAMAQCAMCAQSAAAAGPPGSAETTFAFAAIALLTPVSAALGGTGYLLWRFRGGRGLAPGERAGRDAPARRI